MKPPVEDGQQDDQLIFQWAHREWRGNWLMLGLCLAFASLVGVSLLFRVARVEPRQSTLKPHEVLILDPASPLAQPIIARAADKSFRLMGRRPPDEGEPDLTKQAPVFTPLFKAFDFTLKDLPKPKEVSNVPRWLIPGSAPLPEREKQTGNAPSDQMLAAVPEYRLRAKADGALSSRRLRRQVAVAAPVPDEVVQMKFRAAVAEDGRVTLALPVQEEGRFAADVERLREAVGRLRFEPKEGVPLEWGEVEFLWEAQVGK